MFSKLGDSLYFEGVGKIPVLYIIQYISSALTWKTGQFALTQIVDPVVSWDPFLRVKMTFNMVCSINKKFTSISQAMGHLRAAFVVGLIMQKGSRSASLNLRIPTWTSLQGAKALINGQNLPVPAPGLNYKHDVLPFHTFFFFYQKELPSIFCRVYLVSMIILINWCLNSFKVAKPKQENKNVLKTLISFSMYSDAGFYRH